jgi:Rap1a immunity proteins
MKRAMRIANLAALTASIPCVGYGASPMQSTQAMYETCKPDAGAKYLSCLAYLVGVFTAMEAAGTNSTAPNAPFEMRVGFAAVGVCHDEPVSGAELRQVFLNWAQKNPAKWQDPTYLGVSAAFQELWPCHVTR